MVDEKTRKRIVVGTVTLIVLGGIVGFVLFSTLKMQYEREYQETMAIENVLCWYAEKNAGRMPNSWDDIASAGLAARSTEYPYGMVVPPYRGSKYKQVIGSNLVIEDVRRYEIRFGLLPEDLMVRDRRVFDRGGRPIRVFTPAGNTWCDHLYDNGSWDIAWVMLKVAAQTSRKGPMDGRDSDGDTRTEHKD